MDIKIAKRENNNRRPFLLVNAEQSKHIPTEPLTTYIDCMQLGKKLIDKVQKWGNILIIAFAETATGIGSVVSELFTDSTFVMTTREKIDKVRESEYLAIQFEEVHSHATSHIVYLSKRIDLKRYKTVIIIDDEFTTGNTVINLVSELRQYTQDKCEYIACSFLTVDNAIENFNKHSIKSVWLEKSDEKPEIKKVFIGEYNFPKNFLSDKEINCNPQIQSVSMLGSPNARVDIATKHYISLAQNLVDNIYYNLRFNLNNWDENIKTLRVIGTEEYNYVPILFGLEMQKRGYKVTVQGITRSPILSSNDNDYPIKSRIKLPSLYEEDRNTYLYNADEKVDAVVVITDANADNDFTIKAYKEVIRNLNTDIVYWIWAKN